VSATTQYTTFSDLYVGLMNSVHADTGQTATSNQAKRAINVALQDMHVGMGEKFVWAIIIEPQTHHYYLELQSLRLQ